MAVVCVTLWLVETGGLDLVLRASDHGKILCVRLWIQLIGAGVGWDVTYWLRSARDTQAVVKGDTVRFRPHAVVRRLALFGPGVAALISAFLFRFGDWESIPWLMGGGVSWWLLAEVVSPAEIIVTPRELRESSWFRLRGKVVPWGRASHAVIVPRSYKFDGRVIEYDDIVVVHQDADVRIKHSEGHEDAKRFIEEVQRRVAVHRGDSKDPLALVEPLDLDP